MTEYWVSQGRHFCTFCSCWTADNKPSIQFHEKGKRHQDNVAKKIDELKKKGLQDAKTNEEMKKNMAIMEKAALAAFKKDLEADPDLAIQHGFKPKVEGPVLPPCKTEEIIETPPKIPEIDWLEAKSAEGQSYYWNIKTKATTWVKPEKFKSMSDQKSERKQKKEKSLTKDSVDESKIVNESSDQSNDAQPNTKIVHTSKAKFVIRKPQKPVQLTPILSNTTPLSDSTVTKDNTSTGISQWVPVEKEIEEPLVDLELPTVDRSDEVILPEFSEEPEIKKQKFEEKTVTTLGKRTDIAFKKRKIVQSSKNIRTTQTPDD